MLSAVHFLPWVKSPVGCGIAGINSTERAAGLLVETWLVAKNLISGK